MSNALIPSPKDDQFHFDAMSDRWWETETAWFAFCVPERRIGGWLYSMIRPNIGTVAGGAWVWDDSASLPWEVLYSSNLTAQRLREGSDLRDVELPNGVAMKMLEPLRSYQLSYRDGDRIDLDLRFDAIMDPMPLKKGNSAFKILSHFDQFGRVTGTLRLLGEEIPVDCLAIRDRSWGPRAEHRPNRSAYVTGIASPQLGFLAVTKADDTENVSYGFLLENGLVRELAQGKRTVERDPAEGWVTRIVIEAEDIDGRRLVASGRRLSGIIINRHSFIDSNGLIEWDINGSIGHGEDQDMWPVHQWADFKRSL
ncbi:DUF7065 domain-containing protein [Sphingobium sp. TomTYG45]